MKESIFNAAISGAAAAFGIAAITSSYTDVKVMGKAAGMFTQTIFGLCDALPTAAITTSAKIAVDNKKQQSAANSKKNNPPKINISEKKKLRRQQQKNWVVNVRKYINFA